MTFNKAARYAMDAERSRLYDWTVATQQNEIAEMARTPGSKNKSKTASQLMEALAFVSIAGTKDDQPYKQHVALNSNFAVASDGQLTAGYPITEELECCPHLELLKKAISQCGNTLAIAEQENGALSIKGDKLRAMVPCLPFSVMPDFDIMQPDPNIATIDDRIKAAFAVCGVMVSESGSRMVEAALLLEANACTGTNGRVLMQYWHGIHLPPSLVVPKIFAAAVCKTKSPLVGFGFNPGHSVTFHFENGAWLKTLLYSDAYPDVAPIIDQQSVPLPVPEGFFEAIETVADFNEEGTATITDGEIVSHKGTEAAGAAYEIEGLKSDLSFKSEYIKMIAPFAKTIDLSKPDRAFFFGDNMRGVIMAYGLASKLKIKAPPIEQTETMEQWRARGELDSEIPF